MRPASFRFWTVWLALLCATFFTARASADPSPPPPKKGSFSGVLVTGEATGQLAGRLPATNRPPAETTKTPKTPLVVSGTATGKTESLVTRIDNAITGALDTDTGRLVAATALNPVLGLVTFGGQQLENDGERSGDGDQQVQGALISTPGDAAQGVFGTAYDLVKGVGGLAINGVTTQVKIAAATVTGNTEALVNAGEESQVFNLVQAAGSFAVDSVKSEASVIAAAATGNLPALASAFENSPIAPVIDGVRSAGDGISEYRNTLVNGTADEKAELIHGTARVAGEVTAEVATVVVPGGAGIRAASTAARLAPRAEAVTTALVERGAVARNAPRLTEGVAPGAVRIENELGIPARNQQAFQQFANRRDVVIDVRPTNPASVPWLNRGAVPKPQAIKAKTVNDYDLMLNPNLAKDSQGLVALFRPVLPKRPPNMTAPEWAKLEARYKQRLEEFNKLSPIIGKGDQAGRFRVAESGRVEMLDGNGAWKPITGDHDIFEIRRADGTRLSAREEDALIRAMKDRNMGVEHGPHMSWNPPEGTFERQIFEKILQGHKPGGEPLIRFAPGEEPSIVWANIEPGP